MRGRPPLDMRMGGQRRSTDPSARSMLLGFLRRGARLGVGWGSGRYLEVALQGLPLVEGGLDEPLQIERGAHVLAHLHHLGGHGVVRRVDPLVDVRHLRPRSAGQHRRSGAGGGCRTGARALSGVSVLLSFWARGLQGLGASAPPRQSAAVPPCRRACFPHGSRNRIPPFEPEACSKHAACLQLLHEPPPERTREGAAVDEPLAPAPPRLPWPGAGRGSCARWRRPARRAPRAAPRR